MNWSDNGPELLEGVRWAQSVLAAHNKALARSVKRVADDLGLEYAYSQFIIPYLDFLGGSPCNRPIWEVIEWGTIPGSDAIHVLKRAAFGEDGAKSYDVVAFHAAPEARLAALDFLSLGFASLSFNEERSWEALFNIYVYKIFEGQDFWEGDDGVRASCDDVKSYRWRLNALSPFTVKNFRGDLDGFLANPEAAADALRPILAPGAQLSPDPHAACVPIAFDRSEKSAPAASSVRQAQRIMAEFGKTLGDRLSEAAEALDIQYGDWHPSVTESDFSGRRLDNLTKVPPWTISGWTSVPLSHSRHIFYRSHPDRETFAPGGSRITIEAAPSAGIRKFSFDGKGSACLDQEPVQSLGGPSFLRVTIYKIVAPRTHKNPRAAYGHLPPDNDRKAGEWSLSVDPAIRALALDFDLLDFMIDSSTLVEAVKPYVDFDYAVPIN